MSEFRDARRQKANLETARDHPANLYDEEDYGIGYDATGAFAYGRNAHVLNFFGVVADNIVKRYRPKTYLDAGCAFGMLVEALEPMPLERTDLALNNIGVVADRLLFSSSPDDLEEPAHFNVRPTEEWKAMVAARGFLPAKRSAAPYVAQWEFVR